MSDWIKIEDAQPNDGQNVIACGTWYGEINGEGDEDYMGIGEWCDDHVEVDSDAYFVLITKVTHWMPLPEHPIY